MDYTTGEVAGGWVYIYKGKMPIALVHPRYVDEMTAAPKMYEALRRVWNEDCGDLSQACISEIATALAAAEGKQE